MLKFLPFLLLAAALPSEADTNGALTTVADFLRLSSYVEHEQRPFRLEGTCVCTLGGSIVLDDGTGRANLNLAPGSAKPAAGMRVVVSGRSCVGWLTDLYDDICQSGATVQILSSDTNAPVFARTTIDSLAHETKDLQLVRFYGKVIDVFRDDIDYGNFFLLVRDDDASIAVCINAKSKLANDISRLIDAQVEVSGILMQHATGNRLYLGSCVLLPTGGSVRILSPAPADPFAAPSVHDLRSSSPRVITAQGRRSATGTVLAVRRDGRFLIKDPNQCIVNVTPALQTIPPPSGTRVRVTGYPKTDLYHINLIRAQWRPEPGETLPPPPAVEPDVACLLGDDRKNLPPQTDFYGKPIRLRGTVHLSDNRGRVCPLLEIGNRFITLEAFDQDLLTSVLEDGASAEFTGIWTLDVDNWQPELIVPRIAGAALVIRSADDIRILSRPPWWTPRRLAVAIAILLTALVGFFIWNRILDRLVTRKSRELHREELARYAATQRLEERTRLAAELHDALSQNLSAVACQVNVARSVLPVQTESHALLQTAEQMLQSTRTELTRCLFDLRGSALGEPNFEEAVRQTLSPLDLPSDTTVDIAVSRKHLDDPTAHAVLCMLRELTANAIRHGRATSVRISGRQAETGLEFSVEDNGCGFDVDRRPGPDEGHFGLSGIGDRLRRLGGTLDITSAPGQGTHAVIRIKT